MVTLYSTGCPKCKVLKVKLQKKGIEYEENTNVDEMLEMGLKTAPVLKVGDDLLPFEKAVKWVDKNGGAA